MVVLLILRMVLMAPIMAIGGVIMAASKDVPLSFVIVGAVPVLAGVIVFVAGKAVPLFTLVQKKLDTVNRVLREGLTGIRVVRAFNRVDYERERFRVANRDLTNTAILVNRIMGAMMPAVFLIIQLTMLVVVIFGAQLVGWGYMAVGNLHFGNSSVLATSWPSSSTSGRSPSR